MKKFLAILMAICIMASMLCIPAFAADELSAPAAGVVLRVSALKKDGITEVIKDYDNFEDGWNCAVEQALPKNLKSNKYERIVVDFYDDWSANANGEFGDDDGDGFDNTTIYFPDDVKITLNLKNHTIDRRIPIQ